MLVLLRDASRSIAAGNREHHGHPPAGAGTGAEANVQREQAPPNHLRLTAPLMPDFVHDFLSAMPEVNRTNSEYGSSGFRWPSLSQDFVANS